VFVLEFGVGDGTAEDEADGCGVDVEDDNGDGVRDGVRVHVAVLFGGACVVVGAGVPLDFSVWPSMPKFAITRPADNARAIISRMRSFTLSTPGL